MLDQSKRTFIKISALTMTALPLVSSPSVFAATESATVSAMVKEFYSVYQAWMRAESVDPVDYLRSRGLDSIDDKVAIRSFSKQDFACGNTIHINGFVLSKTEAAAIACLGKAAVTA